MPAIQFEPMTVGGILDQTFRLYRNNFLRFVAIVAVVQVPIGLAALLLVASATGSTMVDPAAMEAGNMDGANMSAEEAFASGLGMGGMLIGVFLAMVGAVLCNAALIKSISESYLGNEVSVGEAYAYILPKVMTIIWAGLLVSFVVTLGFVLLIIPGIIFMVWYILTTQVIVIEDCGATEAMSRSKALTAGNRGKVLAVIILAGLLAGIISLVSEFLGGAVAGALAGSLSDTMAIIASSLISVLGDVLAAPISAAAVILLYYDLRIRKEGFDLQMLAASLGEAQDAQTDHADARYE